MSEQRNKPPSESPSRPTSSPDLALARALRRAGKENDLSHYLDMADEIEKEVLADLSPDQSKSRH